MKILYFDCFNGASASLILSSLIDAGADVRLIKEKLSNYDFELVCEKYSDADIPSTKADIILKSEKTLTNSDAALLAQDIEDNMQRCFVVSAISNFKEIKLSQYLKIYACVVAYFSLGTELALASPLTEGVGYDTAEPVPAPDVLEIMRRLSVPYKIS